MVTSAVVEPKMKQSFMKLSRNTREEGKGGTVAVACQAYCK